LFAGSIIAGAASLALCGGSAQAQATTSTTTAPPATTTSPDIVVTGSQIKRVNVETPSPVKVISATELHNSGYDTITSVLTNITANGAGTLSANNSEAFAGGAAGIALRGLSVGDTLTLIDGHRVAPYPLSDDGERQFVDVQSIPFGAVDSVEVLKDGASAVYGSDAIAGVVNVILKKQITGFEALAEGGTSQHGGGAVKHFAVSMGKGDLSTDGFNAFLTAEYRSQDAILLRDRQYQPWANLDFSRFGGNNLTPGANNLFNANQPSTKTPYIVNPDGSFTFLGSGCDTASLAANKCTYTSPDRLLSPQSTASILGGYTKELGGGWEAKLRVSLFDSKGQQTGLGYGAGIMGYPSFPGASYGGNDSNPVGGTAVPGIGAIGSYTLPANYLGSGSQAGGYLEGVIPGFGLPTINIESRTFRAALDVTGDFLGWDTTESLGFSEVETHETFRNFINFDTLYTDLTTLNGSGQPIFNPEGGNSGAVLQSIAPRFYNTATDRLIYLEGDATRQLFSAPWADISAAVGGSVVEKSLNNPGPAEVLSGQVGGTFSTYAVGSQTTVAQYLELEGNFFRQLELDVAVRHDWVDTYGSSITPKIGVKWKPFGNILALRGTYSQGFRAPTPAEFGESATVFGLGGIPDPTLCPPTPAAGQSAQAAGAVVGQVPNSCSASIGFVQKTTPSLRPETSTSYTGGVVIEPIKNWSTTLDYYNIDIEHQIVSASELPSYGYTNANCARGPDLPIAGVITGFNPDGSEILGTATPLAGPLDACFAGYVNAQSTTTSGLDFQTQYRIKLGAEQFRFAFEFTHILDYSLTAPDGSVYQLAGTHGPSGVSGDTGNPRDHINASASWEHGPLQVALSGYWISSYQSYDPSNGSQTDCAGAFNGAFIMATVTPSAENTQFCRVRSFTSVNLVTTYKVTPKLTATLTVDNLLDASAPVDVETYGGQFVPVNPALHEDGVIGRYFQFGVAYKF
jgi:iron complex outermembrane receptor protein